jgi:fructosamine-3-kinase
VNGVHNKHNGHAPPGFFATEAWGLRWLAGTNTVAVPEPVRVTETSIAVALVPLGAATTSGAERFGRDLADLHAAGAPHFGAPVPGFIGPLDQPLPMDNSPRDDWPVFYAEQRVLPFVRLAVDCGALSLQGAHTIEQLMVALPDLAGPSADEPPSRIHGDLWSGNVLWDPAGDAWLIDPAAHGGHRETDLAMLALFSAPHLERVLHSYDEHRPLADGWRERVALHQLHPLLVHAVLFGGSYGQRASSVAARYV